MRSKKFTILLAIVLVLVLCFSLVACVKDEPKAPVTPEENEPSLKSLVAELSDKLAGNLDVTKPRNLNVDIQGSAALSNKSDSSKLWKYELVAKGNLALGDTAKDDETNLRIEINAYNNENVKSTLISLLYETEMNEDGSVKASYIYLGLPGTEKPFKLNSATLQSLIPELPETLDFSMAEIVNTIATLLFSDGAKVDNNYTFKIDVLDLWTQLSPIIMTFVSDPASLSELLEFDVTAIIESINGIIPEIFKDLTYKGTLEGSEDIVDIPVANVVDLVNYLDQNMPSVIVEANFNFDANDKFVSSEISADYQAHNDSGEYDAPTHQFDINVGKLFIGSNATVAYDEGYVLTKAEREAMTSMNVVNFKINGSVFLGEAELSVEINADIDPFVLVNGFDLSKLGSLGYLSLSIKNVSSLDNLVVGEEVLTLIIDPDKEELIVSLKTPGRSGFPVNDVIYFAGVYNFSALNDIINMINGVANMAEEEEEEVNILEVLVGGLLSRMDISDVTNKGVIFNDMRAFVYEVCDALKIPTSGMADLANLIHGHLFDWSDTLTIKVAENGVKYGGSERIAYDTLNLNGYENSLYTDLLDYNQPISDVTVQKVYENGEAFVPEFQKVAGNMPDTITFKGKTRGGEEKIFNAVYYGVGNYDPFTSGEQTVDLYYGMNSKVSKLLGNSLIYGEIYKMLDKRTPIFGAHVAQVNITVLPAVQTENITIDYTGDVEFAAGQNIAATLKGTLKYTDDAGNSREAAITNAMISCATPDVISTNKDVSVFIKPGKHIVTVEYKGIKKDIELRITGLDITGLGDKLVAGKTMKEMAPLTVVYFDADGNQHIEDATDLAIHKVTSAYGSGDYLAKLFKDGVVVNDFAVAAQGSIVTMSYKLNGETQTFALPKFTGVEYPNDVNLVAVKTGNLYPAANYNLTKYNSPLTTATVLVPNPLNPLEMIEAKYALVYNATADKYELISEEGVALDLDINVEIMQTKEFNPTTNKYDALATPVEVKLSATRTSMGVGTFTVKFEVVGIGYGAFNVSDTPPVAYVDKNNTNQSSLTGYIKAKISTTSFQYIPEAAAGSLTLSLKFNKATREWKFVFDKGEFVEADERDFKYTITVKVKAAKDSTEWIDPVYDGNYGYFTKGPDGKYQPFDIKIKIEMPGFTLDDGRIGGLA